MTKREYLEHVLGKLDAARARLIAAEESPTAPEQHARERYKNLLQEHGYTLMESARALLRVMEPASDDEVGAVLWAFRYHGPGPRKGFRAAEARARRLANWNDDALAGAGAGGGEEVDGG